jgi:hypothetical protein
MKIQKLLNQPAGNVIRLILLTDGTVMAGIDTGSGRESYQLLTPDAYGDYSQGTWSAAFPPPGFAFSAPNNVASAVVLPSGHVLFVGVDTVSTSAVTATFTPFATGGGSGSVHTSLGFSSSLAIPGGVLPLICELADGTILCSFLSYNQADSTTKIFDPSAPSASAWSTPSSNPMDAGPPVILLLTSNYEVPPNFVLAVSYTPAVPFGPASVLASWAYGGGWGLTQDQPPSSVGQPTTGVLLNSGEVLFVDPRNDNITGRFNSYRGVWEPGGPQDAGAADDAPVLSVQACIESTGKVLFVLPLDDLGYRLVEYDDVARTFETVAGGPQVNSDTQLLTLPALPPWPTMPTTLTGQVLVTGSSLGAFVFTPDGNQDSASGPQDVIAPTFVQPGQAFVLTGTQLNGLSQVVYGQNSSPTNYPLVCIRNVDTKHVFYCKTYGHTLGDGTGEPSMGVAKGTAAFTNFLVPENVEYGDSELWVIANGIAAFSSTRVVRSLKALQLEVKRWLPEKALDRTGPKWIVEGVPKGNEGDPGIRDRGAGQEWIRLVQQLAERADHLEAEVERLKSFIRADERPPVGVAPVDPADPKGGGETR